MINEAKSVQQENVSVLSWAMSEERNLPWEMVKTGISQAILGLYLKQLGWLSAKLRNILALALFQSPGNMPWQYVLQNILHKDINLIQICGLSLGVSEAQKLSR